ncbi:MAG TPA: hypothetical protein VKK79_07390 [Candidatus Lokiarchaeia archaeon]|nr:hypothetical protein [Candidatus Lokiarchaeia archaeon]
MPRAENRAHATRNTKQQQAPRQAPRLTFTEISIEMALLKSLFLFHLHGTAGSRHEKPRTILYIGLARSYQR